MTLPTMEERDLPNPTHYPQYDIQITCVKSEVSGCPQKEGDRYIHREPVKGTGGEQGYICPSALSSMYHLIFAMRYGVVFPWSDENGAILACCSEAAFWGCNASGHLNKTPKEAPTVYEIRRTKKVASPELDRLMNERYAKLGEL